MNTRLDAFSSRWRALIWMQAWELVEQLDFFFVVSGWRYSLLPDNSVQV
jgi:hypothetical protein